MTIYSIQIENPYLAELARRVFQGRPVVEHADLLRFLQEQKLKLDLEESQQQLERGDTLPVEEAFAGVYKNSGYEDIFYPQGTKLLAGACQLFVAATAADKFCA